MTQPFKFVPFELDSVGPGGALREPLFELLAPWHARGVSRWLDLIRADGPWPLSLVGLTETQNGRDLFLGAIVAVWAPCMLDRFDDLLESTCPGGHVGRDRPSGGVWHFIAATIREDAHGAGLGRGLLAGGLAWARQAAPGSDYCTLSPAVGLPELCERVAQERPEESALNWVTRGMSDHVGRPTLKILRLHLGAGARLGAVLPESRRDDASSGRVILRFVYPATLAEQEQQRQRYKAWVKARAVSVSSGTAQRLAGHPRAWLVPDHDDASVMDTALHQAD